MEPYHPSPNLIGFSISAVLFSLMLVVRLTMYTPCYTYCSRPSSTCKGPELGPKFKRECADNCARLEQTTGLKVLTEVKNQETGEMSTVTKEVSGVEYVQALTGCTYSGGAGLTCEGVIKKGIEFGLWCEEQDAL